MEVIGSNRVLDLFEVITKMNLGCDMKGKKESGMTFRFCPKQLKVLLLTRIEKNILKIRVVQSS